MAIIINDRRAREAEREAEDTGEETQEEVDRSWHPSEGELPDPIAADRWLVMLDDPTVFDEDGLHAVECVDDYGGPVTFQQLSVRYRGTMGRYRRWLNGVAERAAVHEGRGSLDLDGDGSVQWWPYLYRQRAVGKAGSHVYEMLLQPELSEALRRRKASSKEREQERQRAQQEAEARRRADERRARLEAAARAQAEREAAEAQAAARKAAAPAQEAKAPAATPARGRVEAPVTSRAAEDVPRHTPTPAQEPTSAGTFAATAHFLETMASVGETRNKRDVRLAAQTPRRRAEGDGARLDYAHTYGRHLQEALDLVAEGVPGLTAAQVARELGDESVERLQTYLNGDAIPSFAYVDHLCDELWLDGRWLEAPGELASGLPAFATYRERHGANVDVLLRRPPREVVFITDDGPQRRCGAILRFSGLGCVLLERQAVSADADRYQDVGLSSYIGMVREMDGLAQGTDLVTRSVKVHVDVWDDLVAGRVWPGTVCLAG